MTSCPIISIVSELRHVHCCMSSYQSNSRSCVGTTRVGIKVQMTQFIGSLLSLSLLLYELWYQMKSPDMCLTMLHNVWIWPVQSTSLQTCSHMQNYFISSMILMSLTLTLCNNIKLYTVDTWRGSGMLNNRMIIVRSPNGNTCTIKIFSIKFKII